MACSLAEGSATRSRWLRAWWRISASSQAATCACKPGSCGSSGGPAKAAIALTIGLRSVKYSW